MFPNTGQEGNHQSKKVRNHNNQNVLGMQKYNNTAATLCSLNVSARLIHNNYNLFHLQRVVTNMGKRKFLEIPRVFPSSAEVKN
jgi:hypothetical protein